MGNEKLTWRESPVEFVRDFKAALRTQRPWWSPNKDWIADLQQLNLTQNAAVDVLMSSLDPACCRRGPEPDDQQFADAVIFIFKLPVTGVGDAYLKIGLIAHPKKKDLVFPRIWSFKPWERAAP